MNSKGNLKLAHNQKALTLIEALLVASLFAVLSIAVYRSFSSGVKIWNYGTRFFTEEDIFLFFERIEHDLRNAFVYSLIDFQGGERTVEFAAPVIILDQSQSSDAYDDIQQIGKIRYFFDATRGHIYQEVANYGLALENRYFRKQKIAQGVHSLQFQYFYRNEQGLTQVARAKSKIPSRVVIEMAYRSGEDIRRLRKIIDLPLGF